MRIGFIHTGTNNVYAVIDSAHTIPEFTNLSLLKVDHRTTKKQNPDIVAWALREKLETIFFIGSAHTPDPQFATYTHIRENICPIYHICFDGGDKPWWPLLEQYIKHKCFTKQINIDGVKETPCDLTALCPLDPSNYNPKAKKTIRLGFAGHMKSQTRQKLINALVKSKHLVLRTRDAIDISYNEYCAFLSSCYGVLNMSYTGSGKAHHVKGRVLETMFAGAVVLEMEQAPTHQYFIPGVDYLPHNGTYESVLAALSLSLIHI